VPQPKKPRSRKKAAPKSPPPTRPQPSPSDPAGEGSEDLSTESAKASPSNGAAAGGFVENPGPGFQPSPEDAAPTPAEPTELHPVPDLIPEWEEATLGQLLSAKGELLHGAIGVAEEDWRYTQADLAAIAPPLARILNRYPATRAAAAMGDPLALTIGVLGYGVRSTRERAAVLREWEEEAEQDPGGVTGAPATVQPPPGHPAAAAPAAPAPVAPAPPAPPAPPAAPPAPAAPAPPFDPNAVEWKK
jgi:hypothetical protein